MILLKGFSGIKFNLVPWKNRKNKIINQKMAFWFKKTLFSRNKIVKLSCVDWRNMLLFMIIGRLIMNGEDVEKRE